MKIRKGHALVDRIKIFLILAMVLGLVLYLSSYKDARKKEIKESTIEYFLETALLPVGKTMYIWGGGWDDEDSKAGATSTRIGLSEQWLQFYNQQDANYDFEEHRFERENGLDCSGYVGWVVYNTFESKDGKPGYIIRSTDMAESFAERGWGRLILNPKKFLPGDIVSMEGHVWICLGTCKDGSVLLVHSSPPGVSVCGTPPRKQDKDGESIAIQLAADFMTTYQFDWQEKYPSRMVSSSYLENVSVFRWSNKVMLDAEKMQGLSAEEIIVYISPDI